MNDNESSTQNTFHEITASTAKVQRETLSLLDRHIIAAKLSAVILEMQATLRLLSQNEKPIYAAKIEAIIMRFSDLLDVGLNRRNN